MPPTGRIAPKILCLLALALFGAGTAAALQNQAEPTQPAAGQDNAGAVAAIGRPRGNAMQPAPFVPGRPGDPRLTMPGMVRPGATPVGGAESGVPLMAGETCQDDEAVREANRQSAEQFTEMLNRMAQAAANMSAAQARRNGANVVMAPMPQVSADVTRAVTALLNCGEQRQMADATDRAVEGPIGTTVRWASESRPNVSGSSTVTAAEPLAADGSRCLTVTDIIIVDGEETRAPKRMCRIPPSTRYVRA